jgi:hypothetical protein
MGREKDMDMDMDMDRTQDVDIHADCIVVQKVALMRLKLF